MQKKLRIKQQILQQIYKLQRSWLQNQLDEANGQLNDVQSNLSENLQQVEKLDNKIETSEQTLAEQESKITELKNNIQNVETELNSDNWKIR